MRLFNLFKSEVKDEYARENFSRLEDFVRDDTVSKGNFRFLELNLASDVATGYPATKNVPHFLTFQPKDVIQTYVTRDVTTGYQTVILWNYEDFTRTTVSVTFSSPCTVRAFLGRYGES